MRSKSRSTLVGSWLALLAGCAPDTWLMHEEYLISATDGERLIGVSCEALGGNAESGSGAGGAEIPGYSISHQHTGADAINVVVRDAFGSVLHTESYTRAFLKTGEIDEIMVQLSDEHSLRLRYWGGATCERTRSPETDD